MKEMMISASDRYFAALQKIDRDAYIACFSEDAEVHDPYGSRPFAERSGLEKWFQGLDRTWQSFDIEPLISFTSGDRIAVQWNAEAASKSGKSAVFEGINVFTINEDGLIILQESYWDMSEMIAQIS
jgi:ketosteroid isomerase-like protein